MSLDEYQQHVMTGTRVVIYTSEYITEESDALVPHIRICVGSVW